jgi:serine/threonine-protein kinase
MLLPNKEPKIMDFGIARAPTSNLTAAGEFFGTPSYMSPEQAAGDALDGRSDLFSLGAVLYFLLTGLRAFEGKSVPAILAKVERENPAAPSSVAPQVPVAVDQIVARLLEKKPGLRYQDGLQLGEDIGDTLEDRPPRHATAHATVHGEPTARSKRPEDQAARPRSSVETSALKALEGPRGLLAIGGLLALALLVSLFLPAGSGTPSPSPKASAAGVTAAPSAHSPAPLSSREPSPRPAASASGPAQAASPEPTPAPSRTARLTLAVEHNVKDGRLIVLVDQKTMLDRSVSAKETKKALVFRGRKGELFEVIDVAPGEHAIRVEVQDGDEKKAGQIQGSFKRGEARLLEVRIGGRIELEWR